jgi:hypothetical protein
MGARRIRREQRQQDMAESQIRNGIVKEKERARRNQRMVETLQKGKLPFGRHVMSWLSAQLDKPSTRITQADVDKFLGQQAPR